MEQHCQFHPGQQQTSLLLSRVLVLIVAQGPECRAAEWNGEIETVKEKTEVSKTVTALTSEDKVQWTVYTPCS